MDTKLPYLQIFRPGDFNSIRAFIEKNKALGIEGYERLWDQTDNLCFMLGYQDEATKKPVFVAGIRTQISEFGDEIERRIRNRLGMGS